MLCGWLFNEFSAEFNERKNCNKNIWSFIFGRTAAKNERSGDFRSSSRKGFVSSPKTWLLIPSSPRVITFVWQGKATRLKVPLLIKFHLLVCDAFIVWAKEEHLRCRYWSAVPGELLSKLLLDPLVLKFTGCIALIAVETMLLVAVWVTFHHAPCGSVSDH